MARSITFSKVATLLKVALLDGCFSRFSNCRNNTKLRNASHMVHGNCVFTHYLILQEISWLSGTVIERMLLQRRSFNGTSCDI